MRKVTAQRRKRCSGKKKKKMEKKKKEKTIRRHVDCNSVNTRQRTSEASARLFKEQENSVGQA